jgi:hypothetical protein
MLYAFSYLRLNERTAPPHFQAPTWRELVDAMPIVIFARGLREIWKDRQRARSAARAEQCRREAGWPRAAN